jgi:hypothetical protein
LKISAGLEGEIIKLAVSGFEETQAKKEKESNPCGDSQPQSQIDGFSSFP